MSGIVTKHETPLSSSQAGGIFKKLTQTTATKMRKGVAVAFREAPTETQSAISQAMLHTPKVHGDYYADLVREAAVLKGLRAVGAVQCLQNQALSTSRPIIGPSTSRLDPVQPSGSSTSRMDEQPSRSSGSSRMERQSSRSSGSIRMKPSRPFSQLEEDDPTISEPCDMENAPAAAYEEEEDKEDWSKKKKPTKHRTLVTGPKEDKENIVYHLTPDLGSIGVRITKLSH